jgi:hypothetical protein
MSPTFLKVVEPASIGILLFTLGAFLWGGLRAGAPHGAGLSRPEMATGALWIAGGAWLGEVSCIRLYRFYQYDAPWSLFLDVMPLLVVLIWPVVVLSARELAWSLGWRDRSGNPLPLAVMGWVVLDATLVESVAVTSRLWSWNESGFFGVPWIGVLGWGIYAAAVSWVWDQTRARRWGFFKSLSVPLLAVLLAHLGLLAAWWGGLRWIPVLRVNASVDRLIVGAWLGSLVLSVWLWRRGARAGLRVMGPRIAAAGLFLSLVWLQRESAPGLLAFALAFPWPYLVATSRTLEGVGGRPRLASGGL